MAAALKPYIMPRLGGKTLRGFLNAALEADADLIAVTSFNEWPETTVIEPSLTWADPYLYLGIIADYAGAQWQPPTLPPSEVLDPLILRFRQRTR